MNEVVVAAEGFFIGLNRIHFERLSRSRLELEEFPRARCIA
jgi:hypothetical protein